MLAKPMRSTVAAMMPTKIALLRWSLGRPEAARPMTTALSPASTRSIMMTWPSAQRASPVVRDCKNSYIAYSTARGLSAPTVRKVQGFPLK
jgi:hypothetical protein